MIKALASVFIFALCSSSAGTAAPDKNSEFKSERIADRGYIVAATKDRFFFVRKPGVVESGVPVDAGTLKSGTFCVLQTTEHLLDCPSQEISFRLVKKSGTAVMVDLRLETETAWHRLRRVQKDFAP